MSIVAFTEITKTFGPVRLFDRLGVSFYEGQKVGIIGPNGSGKTTLFRMILGSEKPDTGSVSIQKGLRIGYLPQEPNFPADKTVFEIMHEGLSDLSAKKNRLEQLSAKLGTLSGASLKQAMDEYDRLAHELEAAGGWSVEARIQSVLSGLGLSEEMHHAPASVLSGGQLSRLGLAKVLLCQTDLLLLDEPTNHLDLQAICWLETFLKNYAGAVLIISHDRFLLDQIAGRIVEIENRKAQSYKGCFSDFVRLKKQNLLHRQRQHTQRVEFVRRTQDFIARNKDQEGMRKTARGRKTRLKRLLDENPDFLEEHRDSQTISFRFSHSVSRSEKVIVAEGISKSFGDVLLFRRLSLDLTRGMRLAITGPNGCGKSTLLKILLGHLDSDEGSVYRGQNLNIGYLDQYAQTLNPEHTVLEEVSAVRPDLPAEPLRNRLSAFLFCGDQVFQPVRTLSGGQRNRLMLCKLVLSEPDVLVLDEPTNHLDIASCQVFEEALKEYPGSLVAVSHDRYFLDKLFDELLVMGLDTAGHKQPGATAWTSCLSEEKGVYSLWSQRVMAAAEEKKKADGPGSPGSLNSPSRTPSGPKTPTELRPFNKYTAEQIEDMILEKESKLDLITEQFGSEEVYKNPEIFRKLQKERDRVTEELKLLYRAYEFRGSR